MTLRLLEMRAELDDSTVTPGSTAPDVSRTMPANVACACASEGEASRQTTNSALDRRMDSSLRKTWMRRVPNPPTVRRGGLSRLTRDDTPVRCGVQDPTGCHAKA